MDSGSRSATAKPDNSGISTSRKTISGCAPSLISFKNKYCLYKLYRYRNGLSYKRFGKVLSVDAGPVGL